MAQLVQPTSKDLVITFVKGEGILLKFWGLPVSSLDIVKKFEAQFLKAQYDLEQTSGFLNSNQTPVGFKGAVFSKFKRNWCRARVLQVRGYNELLVQLLDYGNEEMVSVADIRNLDESYFRLPGQAMEFILADVVPAYPNEWSSEAIRFCEQHLVCQTVSCCVVSHHVRRHNNDIVDKVPILRIAKKGERDPFVQRLINSGLAYIKSEIQHHQVPQQPMQIQNMAQMSQPMSQMSQPMAQMSQPMSQMSQPMSQMSQPMSQMSQHMTQMSQPMSQMTQPMQMSQPMSQMSQPMSQMSQPMSQMSQPMAQIPPTGYKMNMLDQNTTHLVKVSFIDSIQKKFFVQLSAVELELQNLMDKIKQYAATENMSLLHAPLVNLPCLAQFSSKRVFYRGVITAVKDGRCQVLFVDYGCTELKDFQELRTLPTRFLGLHAQAICCTFKPGDTYSEKFIKPGEHCLLNCHVLGYNGETFVVRLTPFESQDPPQRAMRPVAAVTPPAPMFYRRQNLDVGNVYDVTVSFINDVSEFYCQLTHLKDHLDQLSAHLNGDYMDAISLAECLPNTPVCVKYSEDDIWYRAKITKVNSERDIQVFFVDFGNYDNASLGNVRKLKGEFLPLPVQAFKCCLFETECPSDEGLKDDMFAFFEELTVDQVLKAHVNAITDGQCYVVTLQQPNSTMSINDKIQKKFAAIGTVPVSDVEGLCVTSFTSPDNFFAQFDKLSDDALAQMQDQINEFYMTRRNISFRPLPGSYVCAKYDFDGHFYRALVESVQGPQCRVFFVDYGNRESVPVQDLHPMQKEFMSHPQFGVECALESIPPATPLDKLKVLMDGANIQARMLKEHNRKWTIALTEDQMNVAILELLRQHEMLVPRSIHGAGLRGFQANTPDAYSSAATGRNGYPNSSGFEPSQTNENLAANVSQLSFQTVSVPLNGIRKVYVSYVISPSEFYLQIEEESSKLDDLMKKIEESYVNNNNQELNLKKLTVEAPCCAMFEEDEVWYRGLIKEVGANKCSVYFVDYGNTDSVFSNKIKALQRQFFGLPTQALRCKSHNVSPKNGTWTDADIDTFSEMTLEKSFMAEFLEVDGNGCYSVNLVSTSVLQKEDGVNKQFVSLLHGRSEPRQPPRQQQQPVVEASKPYIQEYKPPPPPAEVKPKHIPAPNNLKLQPPRVQIGSREDILVPYGLNPGEVFCQLKNTERDFNQMMMNLQNYYNKVSPSESMVDSPHPNMICVAQFLQDMAWYRAQITGVDRNSMTVCYIDYGNCDKVDKQKLRTITQDFARLPIQGIRCRLKGIKPPGPSWPTSQNISRYFDGDTQCTFVEKDGDCFVVDILCDGRSVSQQLVKDGLAASDAPPAPAVVNRAPAQQSISSNAKLNVIPKREIGFVTGQLLSVAVSFVESPYRFWCQLLDESESLDQLMADIEVKYVDAENLPIGAADLVVGSYCMAKYSADEAWYRAQIKSSTPTGECEVFFIDYGNAELTSSSQLASIQPEFLSLPPQCFECRLQRSPAKCGEESIAAFQAVVDTVEELTAKVEVVKDVCVLTLLYEKGAEEVNLSDELFGEAVPVAMAKFPPPDVPIGPHEGYVTEVITPKEFFIQLSGIEDPLADMSTKLSEECEASALSGKEEVLAEPAVGCACSAKYAEDNNWYRAEVIGLQETTADVLFVDYGNTNKVPKDSLMVLSQCFLDIPPYAILCKLNGIVPTGDQWSEAAITSFNEMVLDSPLGITFISKDIPATVNILKDDKDVAQSLVDLELASVETCPETEEAYADDHLTTVEDNLHSLPSDISYPKRKLTSNRLPVKICYVDSYSKFYCMPLELTTELDTVMKTLEILYSPSEDDKAASPSLLSPLEDPAVSMACVAKYSEDENWYRGVITEIDGENIYVTFVDYGNSELTALENLRPVTPELMKIPPIAVECSLHAVQAVEGKEKEIADRLENMYIDEIELEMEIVRAAVPYSVRLHLDGDLSDAFVKEGLAIVVTPAPETIDQELVVKENLKTELLEEQKSVIPLRTVSLDKDLLVSVKFSEIENEALVIYGVPNDLDDSLVEFQDTLQTAYNQIERRVESVACLDFCVAKYAEDELWYRAQVVSREGDEIRVKFVDYGNSEIVAIGNLGKLLPEFITEPQFSIKFCLSGCRVRQDKSEELQIKIDEHFYEAPMSVKICKYSHSLPYICCIDLACGETNIVELLLKEKLLLHTFTVDPQLIHKFEATVESIVDSVFFVLPIQFKEERDKLQSRLLEVCDESSFSGEVDTGRLYAASVEECWSRVAISVINTATESALVKCLDYGIDAEIELSKLRLLPEELCHCPLLLQPCLIANLEEAPDAIESQNMDELKGRIFQCEVLNTSPLQFPLEIKITAKDSSSDSPQEISDVEDTASKIIKGVELNSEILAAIEEDVLAYSDFVADLETDLHDKPSSEIISEVEIIKTDDEKVLSMAEGLCDGAETEQETVLDGVEEPILKKSDVYLCGEDEIEEPILKGSAYVCGDDDNSKNEDSDFEEFQSDEADACNEVLKETDSFVEEMSNLAQEMKKAADDFVGEGKRDLGETSEAKTEQSGIDDPEDEPCSNTDLVESELLRQFSYVSCKDSVVQNGFQNGTESDGQAEGNFAFPDPDSVSFEMMSNVEDLALSETEDEIKELGPESQFPESEAANCLLKTEDVKSTPVSEASAVSKLSPELQSFPESDLFVKLEGATDASIPPTENDKPENLDNVESAESDENIESTESDKLENVESTESDKPESFANIESTESDNLENSENVESTESDKLENNIESTESDKLENFNNVESSEKDKLDIVDSVASTESDKLENLSIESVESDKLENPTNNQATGDSKNISADSENIAEAKSDDMDSVEDLVESSKPEQNPRSSTVEDNEWDERPECDIKTELAVEDTVSENIPKQRAEIHEGLLEDLIGTSWHKSSGKLKVIVTEVSIQGGGSIGVEVEPSPEDLALAFFTASKDAYEKKDHDFPNPAALNLCAVSFNNDWHRAQVVEVKDDTLTVSLIDAGTTETVPRSAVKDLDVAHRASFITAQCSLANVRCLPEKSLSAKDFVNSLLKNGKETFVELVEAGNPIKVNLILDGDNILYKLLPEKTTVQTISPSTITPGQHTAKVSHLNPSSELHAHLVSQLDDLQQLKDSMQAAYPSGNPESPIVESGIYGLQHDGTWVRGQAVASGSSTMALRLVDTGETIPTVSELYPLLPKHCLHPAYAIPCAISAEMLKDVEKASTSEFLVNIEASPKGGIVAWAVDGSLVKKMPDSKGT